MALGDTNLLELIEYYILKNSRQEGQFSRLKKRLRYKRIKAIGKKSKEMIKRFRFLSH